jgi:signal recognition particle receptor subunit beta
MIRGTYVLRKNDGIVLFHRAYSEEKLDEVLISGFLVAVSRFSSELGSGEIDSIVMKSLKFVYGAFENIMIIFYVDRDDDDQLIREDIRKVASQFLYQFGEEVKKLKATETAKFNVFTPDLDRIIHEEVRVKIVFIGEPKVGKTTIARIVANEPPLPTYEPSQVATIKKVAFDKFEAMLWDMPGAGLDGKGWEQMIRGAGVVFVVLDSTLENAVRMKVLVNRIFDVAKGAAVFAIANQQDLNESGNPSILERVLGVPTYGLSATSDTAREDTINIIRECLVISRSGKKKGDSQSALGDEVLRLKLEIDTTRRELKELKNVIGALAKKIAQMETH